MDLIQYLTCPICLTTMREPIMECVLGHSYCFNCSVKIHNCPLCRSPKSEIRNLFFEKLALRLQLPCNSSTEGCNYEGIGDTMHLHESLCLFRTISCPITARCTWRGTLGSAENHCRQQHEMKMSCGPQQRISYDFGAEDAHYVRGVCGSFVFLGPNRTMFSAVWDLEPKTKKARWAVVSLRTEDAENTPKKYKFVVDFINLNKPAQIFPMIGDCGHVNRAQEPRNVFKVSEFITYEMLKEFCYNDDLYFCLTVKEDL